MFYNRILPAELVVAVAALSPLDDKAHERKQLVPAQRRHTLRAVRPPAYLFRYQHAAEKLVTHCDYIQKAADDDAEDEEDGEYHRRNKRSNRSRRIGKVIDPTLTSLTTLPAPTTNSY